MKLGVSTDFGAKNASEWVNFNKELGLEAVVFPLNADSGEEKIEEYYKAARAADICIAEVGLLQDFTFQLREC